MARPMALSVVMFIVRNPDPEAAAHRAAALDSGLLKETYCRSLCAIVLFEIVLVESVH